MKGIGVSGCAHRCVYTGTAHTGTQVCRGTDLGLGGAWVCIGMCVCVQAQRCAVCSGTGLDVCGRVCRLADMQSVGAQDSKIHADVLHGRAAGAAHVLVPTITSPKTHVGSVMSWSCGKALPEPLRPLHKGC